MRTASMAWANARIRSRRPTAGAADTPDAVGRRERGEG